MRLKQIYESSRRLNKPAMVKTFLLCCLLFVVSTIQAQNLNVTGVVSDETNSPMAGVAVKVKNTTNGTLTDGNGKYSINTKKGDILEFTFIGTLPQSIVVGSKSTYNVTMKDNSVMLSKVVVVGYGTAKAKDLTSPIAVVKADDVSKHLTTSPMDGLQGKVAGLQVINNSMPGGSPTVRIRGVGNFDSDKQGPLYVVDGMFFDNIDFLSNDDIESINVLKDASSAAIYGVRAANGVIIVNTKKGIKDRAPKITYDGYIAMQHAQNILPMANTEQYTQMMREIGRPNDIDHINNSIARWGGANGVPSTNTNWYKELTRIAPMTSHSLNINGGSKTVSYDLGASYLNQSGIMRKSDNGFQRINVRAKVDADIVKWLKVGANMIISNSTQKLANQSAWGNAFTSPSLYPVYDPNNEQATPTKYGSIEQIGFSSYFWNPVSLADHYHEQINSIEVMPSFYAQLSFLNNRLTIKSSFNQDMDFQRYRKFLPKYNVYGTEQNVSSYLDKRNATNNNWIWDNIITYQDHWNKHSLTAMLGNSFRRDSYQSMRVEGDNIPEGMDEFWYVYNGVQRITQPGTHQSGTMQANLVDNGEDYRGTSFFGRVMYNYDEKYLVSATFRADGSSKYQERWGYFPSIGLGWVITGEDFMKHQHVFDLLKVRGSWGLLGNDKVRANDGFASLSYNKGAMNDQEMNGYSTVSYFSSLKWEVVNELDFGADFAFLHNRLTGTFDYYDRNTQNAVFQRPLGFGAGDLLMNNGQISNSGIELSLNWADKTSKDFSYNVGFNMSTLKNKVTYLDGQSRIISTGDYATVRMLGVPMDSFYGYKVAGVYQTADEIAHDPIAQSLPAADRPKPGDLKYADLDGDGKLTSKDRADLGSPIPTLYLGANFGFAYKNFDFSIDFQSQMGGKVLNQKRLNRTKEYDMNFDRNLVENRWTGPGSTNKYPSANGMVDPWSQKFSSFFVEKADMFTIQNIQLGYTFKNFTHEANRNTSLRIGFTAENPFSYFTYNGFTPNVDRGIDFQVYPITAMYSIGVKLIY